MRYIRFQKRKKNIWTRRRQGKFEKTLRAHFGGFAIVLLATGFMLNQSGVLRSAVDFSLPEIHWTGYVAAISGTAKIIDGDTLRVGGEMVRLHGIDAPELKQLCLNNADIYIACGAASKRFLERFLSHNSLVTCVYVSRDRYGRFVGMCNRDDGESLAEAMVGAGHALDWPKYSGGTYRRDQEYAKSEKLGIWSTRFEMPWNYRAKRRG